LLNLNDHCELEEDTSKSPENLKTYKNSEFLQKLAEAKVYKKLTIRPRLSSHDQGCP
jgi:hypothetical protein